MKVKVLLILLLLNVATIYAQFGPQQIISTSADLAFRVIPFDVDGDGFIDVIYATLGSNGKIAWNRNQDGLGNFGPEQIITDIAITIEGMELFDLDSDGDFDILYKTLYLDKIAWLENLDGMGNFGTEQIIANTYYPYFISSADIDNDGDLDVITLVHSSSIQNSLIWYENIDGLGTFSSGIFIDTHSDFSWGLVLFDLDNDGDQDIITSFNSGPGKLVWFENLDGQGTFDTEKEIYQFSYNSSWTFINNITATDINGDGKIDLLIDTIHDEIPEEYIYWLENLNTQGSFSLPQFIHNKFTSSGSLSSFDIDNDGDMDVLAAFYDSQNSLISWFENLDGLGDFGLEQIITTEVDRATDATAADINGDGLNDVISASSFDDKIAWYENGILGITDYSKNFFKLYPNPTDGMITIISNEIIIAIEIFNVLGQNVMVTQNNKEINLSNLTAGIYFLRIEDRSGFLEIHKIVKE